MGSNARQSTSERGPLGRIALHVSRIHADVNGVVGGYLRDLAFAQSSDPGLAAPTVEQYRTVITAACGTSPSSAIR
jgi:hypothetical protein